MRAAKDKANQDTSAGDAVTRSPEQSATKQITGILKSQPAERSCENVAELKNFFEQQTYFR